ncbi:hypothetical protein V5O48_016603 [Marasmius crinis-equi]|uniref:Uncharacterized protein n=1 Tax=Marasmius crinis-equi TaxID=585013 RepID=A0ABR3ERB1_9AGAR
MTLDRLVPTGINGMDQITVFGPIKRPHSPDATTVHKQMRWTSDHKNGLNGSYGIGNGLEREDDAASADWYNAEVDETMVNDELCAQDLPKPMVTLPVEDEIDQTHPHFAACPKCSPMEFRPPFSPETLECATTVARLRALLYSTAQRHLDDVKRLAEVTKERDQLRRLLADLSEAGDITSVKEELSELHQG